MIRIKRTKSVVSDAGVVSSSVAYAKSVTPRGNIDAFTADAAQAGQFTAEVAAKVKSFYANKTNAGTFDFEPAGDSDAEKFAAEVANRDVADLAKLRAQLDADRKALEQEKINFAAACKQWDADRKALEADKAAFAKAKEHKPAHHTPAGK